ncbi:hypothetical protein RSAG8_08199, partial [Rhizoctonia solani AG-8 WAC10335]
MNQTGEGNCVSLPLDLGNLAATIALASEALAAAAEALAEAAKAISDASATFVASPLAEHLSVVKQPADVFEKPDPRDESEINEDSLAQLDPQVFPHQQDKSQDILTTATPVPLDSSDSRTEVGVMSRGLPQGDQPSVPRFPQPQTTDDLPEENDTLQPEQNNKLDALPPSPVLSVSTSGNTMHRAWPPEALVTGNPQVPPFRMAMKPYSIIPPGRNYIHFGHASDALAFIAYLALQANRTVCLIPFQLMDSYSKLLKSLTHANVYRAYTPEQVNRVVGSRIDFFAPTSYNIVLIPSSEFIANAESFKRVAPDCVVHWDPPSDVRQYSDRVLSPLAPTVKTCMMLVRQPPFDGKPYGVGPYPTAIMAACFHASSPLQPLRQIASRLLPGFTTPALTGPQAKDHARIRSHRSHRVVPPITTPYNRKHDVDSLPVGHFYIVLDTESDVDLVPLIAYIALKHEKVICHVPGDKILAGYQRLINLISGVTVMAQSPLTNGNQIKAITNRLKVERGVLLRPISIDWNSFFSKSLVNAVLYCGVPADLRVYLNECITKVDHSYLVLTRSQYSDIQAQLAWDQRIQQHPRVRCDSLRPGNLLYNLRQRFVLYQK